MSEVKIGPKLPQPPTPMLLWYYECGSTTYPPRGHPGPMKSPAAEGCTMKMPLAHACDALRDYVTQFHNDMLRRGIKELPPSEWIEEFRSWLNRYDFERQYAETLKQVAMLDMPTPRPGLGDSR